MSMVVAVRFLKLEGDRWRGTVVDQHLEVLNVMDQKSIDGAWQVVSNKFKMPLTEMLMYDSQQQVNPTKDDLERAWLCSIVDENNNNNNNNNPDQTPFQLKLYVVHRNIQPNNIHNNNNNYNAHNSHSPELGGYLAQLESWVSIMETINAHVLRVADTRTQEQATVLKLVGRGLAALLQCWYLFTQSSVIHSQSRQSQQTASTFCPLFERFPNLTQEPVIVNHLSDAVQIGYLISQLIPLFHPTPRSIIPPTTTFQTNLHPPVQTSTPTLSNAHTMAQAMSRPPPYEPPKIESLTTTTTTTQPQKSQNPPLLKEQKSHDPPKTTIK
jgi:hypothetical protein